MRYLVHAADLSFGIQCTVSIVYTLMLSGRRRITYARHIQPHLGLHLLNTANFSYGKQQFLDKNPPLIAIWPIYDAWLCPRFDTINE